MAQTASKTGTVPSGDVTLFYRHFGAPGATPILIHHGAQYYDSADWIDVGTALARDREVVAFDARGYAGSSWSPSKNYSVDAAIDDSLAIVDHFGWQKVIFMGHSRGGAFAILLAARHRERTAGLIVVDRPLHGAVGHPSPGGPAVGNQQKIYPTVEGALADISRNANVPAGSPARARLDNFLKAVEGGVAVSGRDPDYNNMIPLGAPHWRSKFAVDSLWADLGKVQAPTIIIRGSQSDRYPSESVARLTSDYPGIEVVVVKSGHDVAAGARDELIAAVRGFLVNKIDAKDGRP